jgi:hypothetical protein
MKRSTMTMQRIQWTCPICKRRYAIPATAPTPSRCPECRVAEEEGALRQGSVLAAMPDTDDDSERHLETSALSALAAIQLEVAEEAARGPTVAAPVLRHVEAASKTLRTVAQVYTVLSVIAVAAASGGLLYALHAAFALPANHERTVLILVGVAAFCGGLIAALTFYAFREVIGVLLGIEENTRPR